VLSSQIIENPNFRQLFRQAMPALEKLARLVAHENDLTASYSALFDRQPYARARLDRAAAHLAELVKLPPMAPVFAGTNTGISRYIPPGEEREAAIAAQRHRVIEAAQVERDAAQGEADRLQAQMDVIRSRSSPLSSRIVSWARNLSPEDDPLRPYSGRIKPPEGELKQVVVALRDRLKAIEAERSAIESAPYPSSTAKSAMRRFVEQLAERGRPDCLRVVELNLPPHFTTAPLQDAAGNPLPLQKFGDGIGLIAWLHKAELVDRLSAEIDEVANDAEAMDDQQRATRDAALVAETLELERQEEMVIVTAEQQSIEIVRRADANPLAVLGLTLGRK
jgi:hypothetical protein